MRLIFVRHGEAIKNVMETTEPDLGLTELGHRQARRVAEVLKYAPIDVIYCSPLRRAMETIEPITKARRRSKSRPPMILPDLAEHWAYSGYHGMKRGDIEQRFPYVDLPPSITDGDWWVNPDETLQDAYERSHQVALRMWQLRNEFNDAVVCLVGHGITGAFLLHFLLRAPYQQFALTNGGITVVKLLDANCSRFELNITSHLTGKLDISHDTLLRVLGGLNSASA